MIPYILFLLFYIVYSMFLNHEMVEDDRSLSPQIIRIILCVFSIYFLGFEVYQAYRNKCGYLTDLWNIVDVVPPILIICLIIYEAFAGQEKLDNSAQIRHGVQAFTSFFMCESCCCIVHERLFLDTICNTNGNIMLLTSNLDLLFKYDISFVLDTKI